MGLTRSLSRAALILLLAGCGAAPAPSDPAASASAAPPGPSDPPDPSAVVVDRRGGGGGPAGSGGIGRDPEAPRPGLGDTPRVLGWRAEGWWAMGCPGVVRATVFPATDTHALVIGGAKPPAGEVEARVGPASWWI